MNLYLSFFVYRLNHQQNDYQSQSKGNKGEYEKVLKIHAEVQNCNPGNTHHGDQVSKKN